MVPSSWKATKLKYYCKITDGSHHSPAIESEGFPFISVTDVGFNKINFIDAKQISEKAFNRLVREGCKPSTGDVLLTKDGTIGRACIVKEEMPEFVILSSLGLLTPSSDLLNKYLYYYLISGINIDQMNSVIHGSALRRLTISKINDLFVTFPQSNEEQVLIANFLDYETAKIDTLIEKQQRLIELLTEKRQAVISHAVTKGLNPDVPMKYSGVEWLGEVPAHWEVMQFRRITSLSQGLQIPQSERLYESLDNTVEYITIKSIHAGDALENREYIYKPSTRVQCDYDDVLLARTGATGEVITGIKGAFHNNFFKVSYSNRVNKDFLVNLLTVKELKSHLLMLAGTTTIPDLNHGAFLSTKIALPKLEEQKVICDEILRQSSKFDKLLVVAQQAIQLMQERRTALISAAVTGKIDVRDWVKPE